MRGRAPAARALAPGPGGVVAGRGLGARVAVVDPGGTLVNGRPAPLVPRGPGGPGPIGGGAAGASGGGGGSSSAPKRKMRGPEINLDDIPDS